VSSTILVSGLSELQRDLRRMASDLGPEVRKALADVGQPIARRAETLAAANISHIGPTWEQMRIGVTTKGVYLAPKSRRRRGSPRPNLAGLLLNDAMQPAVDESEEPVTAALEAMLDRLGNSHGF
jgi:hypothetical protein